MNENHAVQPDAIQRVRPLDGSATSGMDAAGARAARNFGALRYARYALAAILSFACLVPAWGQNGTPHGITVTATAGTGDVTFNVYQCPGTCTITSIFTQVSAGATLPSVFLPAANFTAGNTYSFVMSGVNASGSESAYSNIATVVATFPVNPPAPTGCNATVK